LAVGLDVTRHGQVNGWPYKHDDKHRMSL
jgi:hypothetical protein